MDKEEIIKIKPQVVRLRQSGLSPTEVGKKLGLTKGQVKYIVGVNYVMVKCLHCGKEFIDRNGTRYCNDRCGWNYRDGKGLHPTPLEQITATIAPPDKNGCWNWLGTVGNIGGYARTGLGGKYQNAHRYIMTLICGDLPKDLLVLHKCDNKLCVNPNHLYLGTTLDNARDRSRRGRNNRRPRLSKDEVALIRTTYKKPSDLTALAQEYNMSNSGMWQIIIGKSYPIDKKTRRL